MKNRKKLKGPADGLLGLLFPAVLLLVMIINLLVPDRSVSETENRALAEKPQLTLSNAVRRDFAERYENYASDQFVGRDMLRSVKVSLSRLGGSHMENGVYIGKNGRLFEEIQVPDQGQMSENLTAIKSFSERYPDIPVSMILAPDAACVLSESLPLFGGVEDQSQLISMVKNELDDSVNWIDAVSVLNRHRSENIYYKTDPHWTSLGAFYVFQEAEASLGIEEDVSDNFVSYTVSDDFNGDLSSRSGVFLDETEQIDIYVPTTGDNDLTVTYVDEARKTTSIYDSSMLETKDQYNVFLGGDSSVIDIKTVSTSSDRILVVKESFADCFIQFLTPFYREIVVVDPCYCTETLDEIMDTYRITDVLILYSGNTFFTDKNISGVFAGE